VSPSGGTARPSESSRRDLAIPAVVALAVRAFYFAGRAHADSFQLPIVDAELFDRAARAFAAGRPTSPDDWFFHGVGYPTILGVLYRLFDASVLAAKAAQLGFGILTSVLTYLVGRDVFDRRSGFVAGLIVAVYAPLIFLEGELLDAGWTALFAIGLIFVTLKTTRGRRWAWGLAWGPLAAAAILVRATFLPYCFLALVLMAVNAARSDERLPWATVLVAAGTMAVILSCAAYGALSQSGRFTVLPSSAGLNLFIGNNADQCRTLALRPGLDWDLMERLPRGQGAVGIWSESDWFRQRAVDYAVHSPAFFAAGLVRKAGALVVSREIPRNVDVYLFRDESQVLRVGLWKLGPFGFPFGLLLPFAMLGAIAQRRRVPWPMWLMLGSYAAVLVAVFAVGRYRIALVPPLAILAAAGVMTLAAAFRQRAVRRILISFGLMLPALLLTAAPWRYCAERLDLRPELTYLLAAAHERRDETEAAEQGYRDALRLNPGYFEARHDLGRLLLHAGRFAEAAEQLAAAAALRPDHVPLLLDLAVSLGRSGQLEQAVDALDRAGRLEPNNAVIYNDLGMVFVMRHDFHRAAEQFAKAVELDPGSATYRENLRRAAADASGAHPPAAGQLPPAGQSE
jgi:Tfp pilus assembly protein PilF/4-amino-4-deoxy-L-arabinose transferase-like glycosyltransferase